VLATLFLALAVQSVIVPTPKAIYHPYEFYVDTNLGSITESDTSPNPWKDYRLEIIFTPDGASTPAYIVPGFYCGDTSHSGSGDLWCVRWAPPDNGSWDGVVKMWSNPDVNAEEPDGTSSAGTVSGVHDLTFDFTVGSVDTSADGFLSKGFLRYSDGYRYLQHSEGAFFLKCGMNSPEDFLSYNFYDNPLKETSGDDVNEYDDDAAGEHSHQDESGDHESGEPDWSNLPGDENEGIIGALNYVANAGLNSFYFLPYNFGGDARNCTPFLQVDIQGYMAADIAKRQHYDASRCNQWWETVDWAQRKAVYLDIVLAEEEEANWQRLDDSASADGDRGITRSLFLKHMAAMFSPVMGLTWILCEENGSEEFSNSQLNDMAEYLQHCDAHDHPITVHTENGDTTLYDGLLDDGYDWLRVTSLQKEENCCTQTSDKTRLQTFLQDIEDVFDEHDGVVPVLMMDEVHDADAIDGDDVDAPENSDDWRKKQMWDVLLSGANLGLYCGDAEDFDFEDFDDYKDTIEDAAYAHDIITNWEFWLAEPRRDLVTGETDACCGEGGAEVLAKVGNPQFYIIYYPDASNTGSLDLLDVSSGTNMKYHWLDPSNRNASVPLPTSFTSPGGSWTCPSPPSASSEDWVLIVWRP